jgi:predicted ATPase with chaperone activity
VPTVRAADLVLPAPREGSAEVAARVGAARTLQRQHYQDLGLERVRTNAQADGEVLEDVACPDAGGLTLLRDAAEAMGLSARGYHRVLRVARTLADLGGGSPGACTSRRSLPIAATSSGDGSQCSAPGHRPGHTRSNGCSFTASTNP